MPKLKLYLVCYDIEDDRTRTRLSKRLLDFGFRVQNSVFECWVDDRRYSKLLSILNCVEFKDNDKINIYPMLDVAAEAIVYLNQVITDRNEAIIVF